MDEGQKTEVAVTFTEIVNEKLRMGSADAFHAAEAIISKQSIDIELLHSQLKTITKYAEDLYNENQHLNALLTEKNAETVENFSKEERRNKYERI